MSHATRIHLGASHQQRVGNRQRALKAAWNQPTTTQMYHTVSIPPQLDIEPQR